MEIMHQNVCMTTRSLSSQWNEARPKKSGPIAGATVQKRQRVGKSGKAMQGTDPPAGPAYWEIRSRMTA
jgi:hypothetical protein